MCRTPTAAVLLYFCPGDNVLDNTYFFCSFAVFRFSYFRGFQVRLRRGKDLSWEEEENESGVRATFLHSAGHEDHHLGLLLSRRGGA